MSRGLNAGLESGSFSNAKGYWGGVSLLITIGSIVHFVMGNPNLGVGTILVGLAGFLLSQNIRLFYNRDSIWQTNLLWQTVRRWNWSELRGIVRDGPSGDILIDLGSDVVRITNLHSGADMWLFRVAEHLHLDLRVGPQVKASLENLQIKSTKVPLVLASSAGMSCASLLGLIQGRKTWDQVLITALVGVVVGLIIAYASPQTSFSESGIHRTMWWGLKKKFVAWSAIKAVSEPRANVEMNISIWTDKEGFNIADLDGIGKLWRDVLQTHLDSDTLCLTRMHAIPVESQATAPFSTE